MSKHQKLLSNCTREYFFNLSNQSSSLFLFRLFFFFLHHFSLLHLGVVARKEGNRGVLFYPLFLSYYFTTIFGYGSHSLALLLCLLFLHFPSPLFLIFLNLVKNFMASFIQAFLLSGFSLSFSRVRARVRACAQMIFNMKCNGHSTVTGEATVCVSLWYLWW